MADVRALEQVTVETGHVRRSPLREVGGPDALASLRSALAAALASADPVHVGGGWSMVAREDADALEAALFPAGMAYPGPPGVLMRVEHRDGRPPLLTAAMAGLALGIPDDPRRAAREAAGIERRIAWAWLTMGEAAD